MTTTTAQPKNQELKEQSVLIRTVEANLKVAVPDDEELKFRASLLTCAATRAAELPTGFVVRLYEAACEVKFPEPAVTGFRLALQRILGQTLDLRKYRPTPNASAR